MTASSLSRVVRLLLSNILALFKAAQRFLLLAAGLVTFSAAEACDVPISFYLISDQTLLADAGLVKAEQFAKDVQKFRDRAASNVMYLANAIEGNFSVCLKEIEIGGVDFLSRYPDLKLDVDYWMDVKRRSQNGTLSKEERSAARERAAETCGRVILGMGGLLRFLRVSGTSLPAPLPMPLAASSEPAEPAEPAELPLIVIVTGAIFSGSPCDSLTSIGLVGSVVSTFTDPLDFAAKLGKNFSSYVGSHLVFEGTNPARSGAKPFLRGTRAGIHLFSLDREDKTFVHEIGHQLGLSHLHSSIKPCILSDNDNDESGVTDTPPMSASLDDVSPEYPEATSPDKFPTACRSVKDEDGTIFSKMPFDNFMNQGDNAFYRGPMRFSKSQLKVMTWMVRTMRGR